MIANFKRVKNFSYHGNYFKLYIDKNDSIYDITECTVVTWKEVVKRGRKSRVPDEISEIRSTYWYHTLKGNPTEIAIDKIRDKYDCDKLLKQTA